MFPVWSTCAWLTRTAAIPGEGYEDIGRSAGTRSAR